MLSVIAGDIIMFTFAESQSESSGAAFKWMSLEEFLEQYADDKENEKVAADFYPLSSNTVMFQWSKVPVEGQPLLDENTLTSWLDAS